MFLYYNFELAKVIKYSHPGMQMALSSVNLIDLWVPLFLLSLIGLAALFFSCSD